MAYTQVRVLQRCLPLAAHLRVHVAQQVEERGQQVALAAGEQRAHAAPQRLALAHALGRQLQRSLQLLEHAPGAQAVLRGVMGSYDS